MPVEAGSDPSKHASRSLRNRAPATPTCLARSNTTSVRRALRARTRFSARESTSRVAAGALAKLLLR